MQIIERHIAAREGAWRQNRFFAILDRQLDAQFLAEFARRMVFWPLAFQDVMRVLSEAIEGTALDAFVEHHAVEDRGHDLWFLHDLKTLGVPIPSVDDVFRADHEPARRAGYAILAESLNARTGSARIAVLFAIESTGQVFFGETCRFIRRVGYKGLKYFSDHHLLVESSHSAFEEAAMDRLRQVELSDEERQIGLLVADHCFDAIEAMFDSILNAMPEDHDCFRAA